MVGASHTSARAVRHRALALALLPILLIAFAAAVRPSPARGEEGTTLYVDKDGRGGSPSDRRSAHQNSISRPWKTIATAMAKAPAGSTVYVRKEARGEYADPVASNLAKASRVTIKAFPGDADRERPRISRLTLTRCQNFRFEGFEFTTPVGVRPKRGYLTLNRFLELVDNRFSYRHAEPGAPGIRWDGNDDALLADNLFDGFGSMGVFVDGLTRNTNNQRVVVRGNLFRNGNDDALQFPNAADPQAAGPQDWLVENNRFINLDPGRTGNHADSLQVFGPASGITIRNNISRGSRGYLLQPNQTSFRGALRDVTIDDNVFLGREFAIRAFNSPGIVIANNTIWGTSTSPQSNLNLRWKQASTAPDSEATQNVVLFNNIIRRATVAPQVTFAARSYNLYGVDPSLPLNEGEEVGMPAFVDLPARDARLAPGSPGIDAGASSAAPSVDRHGYSRADDPDVADTGSGPIPFVDLGADERKPGPTGPNPDLKRFPRTVHVRARWTRMPNLGGMQLWAAKRKLMRRGVRARLRVSKVCARPRKHRHVRRGAVVWQSKRSGARVRRGLRMRLRLHLSGPRRCRGTSTSS